MDGATFPLWANWVSLSLAVAGTALGLISAPTALQMLFGKPAIAVEFTNRPIPTAFNTRVLSVTISNTPISGRMLRLLGVVRSPVLGLSCMITLTEKGTGRELSEWVAPLIHLGRAVAMSQQADISPGHLGVEATVIMAMHSDDEGGFKAWIFHDEHDQMEIMPGKYLATASIITGQPSRKLTRPAMLQIGTDLTSCYWAATLK